MSHTAATLDSLLDAGRPALIGYLPAGYPSVQGSIEAACAMVDAGADIVEMGIPYSDPVMDGPVIQRAVEGALAAGTRVRDVFTVVGAIREHAPHVPVLVMTYLNPVLRYGIERFATDLEACGGAGLITPDLIVDEASEWIAAADRHDLDKVFLVAPSSTPQRLRLTAAASRGFVYAASTMGVTGERAQVGQKARDLVAATREAGARHVCVGLGVSTADQAAEVGSYADGVIVGSAFVHPLIGDGTWAERVDALAGATQRIAAGVARARKATAC